MILAQAAAIPERIKNAIAAFRGSVASAVTGIGSAVASTIEQVSRLFQVSGERSKIHKDIERMDKDSEIVSSGLDALASRAVGMEDPTLDAFQVTLEANPISEFSISDAEVKRAQLEVDRLIERLDLRLLSWQIARFGVKFGNEFREAVVDYDLMEIVRLKQLPEHTMWPKVDKDGNRLPGYEQKLDGLFQAPREIPEFNCIHFTFGELDGYLGTPLLRCARKNFKRVDLALDVTAIARLVRGFPKFEHKVPVDHNSGVSEWQKAIDVYKEKIQKVGVFNQRSSTLEEQESPSDVSSDFFIPDDGSGRGGVTMHDPSNEALKDVTDILLLIDLLITALHVPKRYFPFEGSTPKLSEGGGTAEDKHFACTIMLVQAMLRKGFIDLFNRQLLLKGINYKAIRYVIRFGDINTTDQLREAQAELVLAKVAEIWLKLYPEMREQIGIMLREFAKVSDASMPILSALKIVEQEPEPDDTTDDGNAAGDDKRTAVPGMGNKEARANV